MKLPDVSIVSIDSQRGSAPVRNRVAARLACMVAPGETRKFRVSIDDAREYTGAEEVRVWSARRNDTGVVDCVIGPCTFDEMIATLETLGDPPLYAEATVRGPSL